MSISWQGKVILTAKGHDLKPAQNPSKLPAEPVFLGYPHGPKTADFVPSGAERETHIIEVGPFTAHVDAGKDAFECDFRSEGPVGGTFGRPTETFGDSIYDRSGDWLLRFVSTSFKITPHPKSGFDIQSTHPTKIIFRPNYYRDHLGYFLWDKSKPLWTKPVAGWCSWMAYLQNVTEANVLDAARFFSKNLKDYGYNVIQIDDGYQRVLQFGQEHTGHEKFSDYWTKPNERFLGEAGLRPAAGKMPALPATSGQATASTPAAMESLAHQIRALGLTPGIWIGYYLPLGLDHSEGYVQDPDGKPHKGPWVNYAMNGFDKPAIDEAYVDTIREFKRQGWDYFKIDTLRHILYDSYRQVPDYWKARGQSMEQAYRNIMAETKKAAGNSYVMACWGTLPELAGLPDGARIGEDVGPNFDSMRKAAKYIAQFQYLNNVVWHNDPDYMCFRVPIEQARTWATMNFLAGGHLMVSDPVADYDAAHLDALRRVGPPIFTHPLNVVSHGPDPEYMTLVAEKGGEEWMVLARFAWQDLPASDPWYLTQLRMAPKYLAFDFWDEKFLGVVDVPSFHALAKGSCQVICLRPLLDRPQVLGDNRHLSQGAYELDDVKWDGHRLSGRFQRGPGQAWSLYIHVPAAWKVKSASAPSSQDGGVLKLTFPVGATPVDWCVDFERRSNGTYGTDRTDQTDRSEGFRHPLTANR